MLIAIRLSSTKRLDDGLKLVPKRCVARLFLFEASAPGLEGVVFSLQREVGAILTCFPQELLAKISDFVRKSTPVQPPSFCPQLTT